jgi:hypothetical protein
VATLKNRPVTRNILTNRITLAIFPLLFGGLIYLTYRVETLKMFRWFDNIGATAVINFLRTNKTLHSIYFPEWVKFSLPDALWIFSFTYFMLTIWKFKITPSSAFWIFLAPTIGLVSEIGQLFGFISGTFDIVDLILIIVALTIPFSKILILNFKSKSYEQIKNA